MRRRSRARHQRHGHAILQTRKATAACSRGSCASISTRRGRECSHGAGPCPPRPPRDEAERARCTSPSTTAPTPRGRRACCEELDRCQARATFFMVGERVRGARSRPHGARRGPRRGAPLPPPRASHRAQQRELERDTELGLAALERRRQPALWRAPWGVCSDASGRVAKEWAAAGGLVDRHARLARRRAAGDARRRAGAPRRRRSVLMHDALGPGALRRDCANTTALLAGLTAAAREPAWSPCR